MFEFRIETINLGLHSNEIVHLGIWKFIMTSMVVYFRPSKMKLLITFPVHWFPVRNFFIYFIVWNRRLSMSTFYDSVVKCWIQNRFLRPWKSVFATFIQNERLREKTERTTIKLLLIGFGDMFFMTFTSILVEIMAKQIVGLYFILTEDSNNRLLMKFVINL